MHDTFFFPPGPDGERRLLRTHFWALMGSPAVSGSINCSRAGTSRGSFFFHRGPAATHLADPLPGTPGQLRGQFRASTVDGLLIQPADLRDK